jgi:hypothetical protein
MMRSFLLVFALLFVSPALADDVPPPPTDCPPGTTGDTGHEGPHCIPLNCSADADCKDGKVCQELPLCIEEQMLTPGRSRTPNKYTFAYEACAIGGKCSNSAAICTAGKRCVAPTSAPKTTKTELAKKGSFGCAVSSPDTSAQSALLFLFLFGGALYQGVRARVVRSRRLD